MKLTIDHNIIKALIKIAPKQDVRYYLVGMLIDVRAADVTLVATNGHALLAVPLPADALEGDQVPGQYIIGRDALEAVKPVKVGRTTLPISIGIGADGAITITGATTATAKLIDGRYPDWRRVMPTSATLEVAQFDPAYVSLFGDVRELLGGSSKGKPVIHHNGDRGALVSGLGRDALGVLMPMRADAHEMRHPGLPAWCSR